MGIEHEPAHIIDADMAAWKQGFVADQITIYWPVDPQHPLTDAARNSLSAESTGLANKTFELVAVVTQTCDIVRAPAKSPFIQVAPVVDLTDSLLLSEARGGHSPRYAPLPLLGDTHFADLDLCGTVEKTVLAKRTPFDGCGDDERRADFARATARHRSRFAFPDGTDNVLEPLRKKFREKHSSTTSAEGRILRHVVEIRAQSADGWSHDGPYRITLKFIIDDEVLPDGAEEEEPSETTRKFVEGNAKVDDVAKVLDDLTLAPGDRYRLWQKLAEAWKERCATDPRVVIDDAEAISAATYTLAEAYREPRLDLDHLSSSDGIDHPVR